MGWRHEEKYFISSFDAKYIQSNISSVASYDIHTGEDDKYTINSVYFDTIYDNALVENESGISPREKWRIRTYNYSDKLISLECKQKERNMIKKKSCKITRSMLNDIFDDKNIAVDENMPELLKRFLVLRQTQIMLPKVIVCYDRIPFVYPIGNVRITLDLNICSVPPVLEGLFSPDIEKRSILSVGQHLLEVKYDEFLPDYLYRTLQLNNMQQITFSKYYLCRKYSLMGGVQ